MQSSAIDQTVNFLWIFAFYDNSDSNGLGFKQTPLHM